MRSIADRRAGRLGCDAIFRGMCCAEPLLERGRRTPSHFLFSTRRCVMLWTVLLIILIMWALGIGFGVAGNLVHLLLLVALVVLVVQVLQGRRAV